MFANIKHSWTVFHECLWTQFWVRKTLLVMLKPVLNYIFTTAPEHCSNCSIKLFQNSHFPYYYASKCDVWRSTEFWWPMWINCLLVSTAFFICSFQMQDWDEHDEVMWLLWSAICDIMLGGAPQTARRHGNRPVDKKVIHLQKASKNTSNVFKWIIWITWGSMNPYGFHIITLSLLG